VSRFFRGSITLIYSRVQEGWLMMDKYIIVKENDSYFFNGKGYLLQNMNGDLPFWVMGRSLIHFNVVACLLKIA
jgi:hypothetical protein